MSEFVGALSKTDLAAAVKIVDEFDVPELVSRSLPELAVEFAKQDPQQAADWVMTTGGPAQAEAMRSVLARWSSTNDEEAEAWVVDHGTAVDRDTMAAGLSEGLLGEEPDRATDWALTIADQELREERLKSILIHRVNEDSHSLARWLNTQSEDVQAQLRALDDRVAVFAPTHPTLHK